MRLLKIFVEAFSKEHPKNIAEVAIGDLPIFLSGALSAIHWHAQNISQPDLAKMIAQDEFLSIDEERPSQQIKQEQIYKPTDLEPESVSYSFPPNFVESVGEMARMKVEMAEMREMEATRTILALVATAMIFFLLITGASIAGSLFAIFASLLYISWPYIQPFGAATLVELSIHLKSIAEKSRHRAGKYDD